MILKKIIILILIFVTLAFNSKDVESESTELAPTPPMGWNSWDCFGTTVTEDEVKANADYMAKHLLKHGWEYIVVDIQWSEPNAKAHGYRKFAKLEIDRYGRLIPAVNRFPSSAEGNGFKPLADYIHNLGLKFGIHIMRGIPRQAVRENLPIKNTEYYAKDIADTNSVCPWNTDMFGVRADTPGGQAYYNSIIELYSEWGVDYIKADDMTALNGNPADENRLNDIKMLSTAIKKSDRPIVLSLSPGPASITQAEFLEEHAQLWRISDDFWDKWSDILQQFDYMRTWQKHIGPKTWPDADMLPIGKIGIRAERGDSRFTRFTKDEQITLMSLWSLFKSPLMFGGNLPDNDKFTLELITNDEVLAVNQHSKNNHEVYNKDGIIAWTADAKNSEEIYLGIFNTTDVDTNVVIDLKSLGLSDNEYRARDIWIKEDIDSFKDSIKIKVNLHGAKLLKLNN
ncbi:MAG: glycoside hydrolase family 27 protein [Bacteroidetes bacterium]|nr:glycoside hydrolase family 27 protein [Bacteroidota bacterium]MBU1116955.1 glycoside hydrolase family 27 protein [Bacteroidota bacterium]MBU1799128.1 glycoside hydrolase family 27 protein [Bacteroidota bacterium]